MKARARCPSGSLASAVASFAVLFLAWTAGSPLKQLGHRLSVVVLVSWSSAGPRPGEANAIAVGGGRIQRGGVIRRCGRDEATGAGVLVQRELKPSDVSCRGCVLPSSSVRQDSVHGKANLCSHEENWKRSTLFF